MKQPDEQRTYVILQILKNGEAVSNVFIGEKLTALIESDVDRKFLTLTFLEKTDKEFVKSIIFAIFRSCKLGSFGSDHC